MHNPRGLKTMLAHKSSVAFVHGQESRLGSHLHFPSLTHKHTQKRRARGGDWLATPSELATHTNSVLITMLPSWAPAENPEGITVWPNADQTVAQAPIAVFDDDFELKEPQRVVRACAVNVEDQKFVHARIVKELQQVKVGERVFNSILHAGSMRWLSTELKPGRLYRGKPGIEFVAQLTSYLVVAPSGANPSKATEADLKSWPTEAQGRPLGEWLCAGPAALEEEVRQVVRDWQEKHLALRRDEHVAEAQPRIEQLTDEKQKAAALKQLGKLQALSGHHLSQKGLKRTHEQLMSCITNSTQGVEDQDAPAPAAQAAEPQEAEQHASGAAAAATSTKKRKRRQAAGSRPSKKQARKRKAKRVETSDSDSDIDTDMVDSGDGDASDSSDGASSSDVEDEIEEEPVEQRVSEAGAAVSADSSDQQGLPASTACSADSARPHYEQLQAEQDADERRLDMLLGLDGGHGHAEGGDMQPASSSATDAADAEPSTASDEEPAGQGSQDVEHAQPLAADACPPEPVLEARTRQEGAAASALHPEAGGSGSSSSSSSSMADMGGELACTQRAVLALEDGRHAHAARAQAVDDQLNNRAHTCQEEAQPDPLPDGWEHIITALRCMTKVTSKLPDESPLKAVLDSCNDVIIANMLRLLVRAESSTDSRLLAELDQLFPFRKESPEVYESWKAQPRLYSKARRSMAAIKKR